MSEIRTYYEGTLAWIQASASGGGMTTASAAASSNGPIGFVQAGMRVASAQSFLEVKDRGIPSHHKAAGRDFIELQLSFKEAITANDPAIQATATAGGASVPMLHFELRSDKPEVDGTSGLFRQFTHGVLLDNQWTEGEEGNMPQQTWRFLAMKVTASGVLLAGS